ncbi:hypothetical protein [Bradyrhizobium icense]|uniref:Uncharacterized protein n=1 Tax=Bradyrhizobium icense TaxID=1274631 RepID=A0A1B1UJ36_9BRAD|nr:hypothetical protein [Bradyrhizobium icense]ANW02809.1 hypothetical protein LMTR13_24275 [Bradyrhizobium icense]
MTARADFQKIYAQLDEQKEPFEGGPKYHYLVLSQLESHVYPAYFQGYHHRHFTLRDGAGLLNMNVTTVAVMEKAAFGMAGSTGMAKTIYCIDTSALIAAWYECNKPKRKLQSAGC